MSTLGATTYIAADYQAVWDAWTTAEGYGAWASSPCIEFGSNVGDRLVWGIGDAIVYVGAILTLEPGAGLSHSFSFRGFGFEESSVVAISIESHGDVILVDVRHDVQNAPQTAGVIGERGWLKSIARLKTWLEAGREMPWPDR